MLALGDISNINNDNSDMATLLKLVIFAIE